MFGLSGATLQKLGSSVRVGVRCTSEACTASARATVRVPATRGHRAKTYTLTAARSVSIAKGATKVLAPKLPALARAAIRRALTAHKRVSVRVTLTVKDAAGNAASRTRVVRLRR